MHDPYAGVTVADLGVEELRHKVARLERIVQILADGQQVDLDKEWNPEKYYPKDDRTFDEHVADGAMAMSNMFMESFYVGGLPEDQKPPKRVIVHDTEGFGYNQHSLPEYRWVHEYNGEKRSVHNDGYGEVNLLYEQYERDRKEWENQHYGRTE